MAETDITGSRMIDEVRSDTKRVRCFLSSNEWGNCSSFNEREVQDFILGSGR